MHAARLHRTSTALVAAAAIALLALSGCSGGDSASTAEPAPAQGGSAQQGAPEGGAATDQGTRYDAKGQGSSGVNPTTLQPGDEMLARRAQMAVQVKGISAAVDRIRAISARVDGLVLTESIGSATDSVPMEDRTKISASTYGEITISVPASRLDEVMTEVGRLGTLIRSGVSSENVRAQVVDTESRVKTMRASVDRVRALMARATEISQIVTLEAELSRRQADLEALESQLASLKDSVARSPLQISLTTESGVIKEDPGTGFLAGLMAGWDAFTASVVVVLTVLGALLPFAFVLALVLIPLWLVLRRRRAAAPSEVSAG
jgi:hypothetical protein